MCARLLWSKAMFRCTQSKALLSDEKTEKWCGTSSTVMLRVSFCIDFSARHLRSSGIATVKGTGTTGKRVRMGMGAPVYCIV